MKTIVLDRPGRAQGALGELQHDRRRDGAVGLEELDQLLERGRVGQDRSREIAEQADIPVLDQQAAHDLHAAEDHEIVDPRHQAGALRRRDEVGRRQHLAGLAAQPRQRFVVADLPLRQRHDRLQVKVDAVGLDADEIIELVRNSFEASLLDKASIAKHLKAVDRIAAI